MPNSLTYLIWFDGDTMPAQLRAESYLQLKDLIDKEVEKRGKPYEWIIRIYR